MPLELSMSLSTALSGRLLGSKSELASELVGLLELLPDELSGSIASSTSEPMRLAVLLMALPALETVLDTLLPAVPLQAAIPEASTRDRVITANNLFMVKTLSANNFRNISILSGYGVKIPCGGIFLIIDRIP